MWNKIKKTKVSDDTVGAIVILGLGLLVIAVPPLLMLFGAILLIVAIAHPYIYGERMPDSIPYNTKKSK